MPSVPRCATSRCRNRARYRHSAMRHLWPRLLFLPGDPHYSGFWGSEVAASEHLYWSKARARMHGDFFKRFVAGRSGRLLDMGCGLGFFLKAMAPYKAWDAYGCEISPAAVRYAREQLRLDNVICTRLQDADLPRASFDMIVMWDVLDHIPHPDPLLSHCRTLLKEDGVLFIRSPNVATQLFRARLMNALGRFQTGRQVLASFRSSASVFDAQHAHAVRAQWSWSVSFVHLHPIESDRRRGAVWPPSKNMAFQVVRALAVCTGGRQNLDNLFVVARKGAALHRHERLVLISRPGSQHQGSASWSWPNGWASRRGRLPSNMTAPSSALSSSSGAGCAQRS